MLHTRTRRSTTECALYACPEQCQCIRTIVCCHVQQVPAAALRKVAEQDPDNALGYYLVAIDKQTRKTCNKDVGELLRPTV